MPQVLVREVETSTLDRLKKRARENGRSLQSELRQILEDAVRYSPSEMRAAAERIRKSLMGRKHSDSVELIREDRDR
ncbi:MAG: FitA-like ribbon-helix-helix domain-containing protein [Thermoanaerobaculia bacterium]